MREVGLKTRLLTIFDSFRESFWFRPTSYCILAFPVALGMLQVDELLSAAAGHGAWFVRDASAAQKTLSFVSGTVITLMGIVLSITLVTISMASSQFGSRLLRGFLADSIADRLFGLLMGTSLYCFIILQQIHLRENVSSAFVPQFSIAAAVVLGFGSIGMLIWFVHDTSLSIQAPRLIANVAAELDSAVDRLFPDELTADDINDRGFPAAEDCPDSRWTDAQDQSLSTFDIFPPADGYIEGIDLEDLTSVAANDDLVIKLRQRPGHFVCSTTPLATVFCGGQKSTEFQEQLSGTIHGAFVIGTRRIPRQDIGCCIVEIVEIAVRALSPGINNPFAAMNCIDRLGASLARLASRRFPSGRHYDSEDHLRCVAMPVEFSGLLDDAFSQIRQYGSGSVAVCIRLIEALIMIAKGCRTQDRSEAIRQHADAISAAFFGSTPADIDVQAFQRRWNRLRDLLD